MNCSPCGGRVARNAVSRAGAQRRGVPYTPFRKVDVMIKLTRLGGEPFILNAELIRYVEARPDTYVTLTTGERIVVVESMDEVMRRAVVYQQAKHLVPPAPPSYSEPGT